MLWLPGVAAAEPLNLVLPTSNDALLRGDGPEFYQYTDRYFNGKYSQPWEGGQYGFVRNQKETPAGIVYTRFHEGVDIKPVYRDAHGEPLDTVRAIDHGRVVYVNRSANGSSYGKYVVVEHIWSGAPFYSLYAHLGDVDVRMGQGVRRGDRLGMMGYTGRGIDRRRAHLHFEVNMMLNRQFDRWFRSNYRGRNSHAVFNGQNLAGLDVAALYLALQNNPRLTIDAFLARQEVFFTVLVPNEGPLDLQLRYPWLARSYDAGAPSQEIGFTQSGLPVRVRPAYEQVSGPSLAVVQPMPFSYDDVTNYVAGHGRRTSLSSGGNRYISLLALSPGRPEDLPPAAFAEETAALPVQSVAFEEPRPQPLQLSPPEEVRQEQQPVAPEVTPTSMPVQRVRGW